MERKILPVKSDVIFRLFFADERNKDFLIAFLKAVLRLPEDEYDVIEIVDPHLLREFPDDKLGIIDVKLLTKSRSVIHIEIQLSLTPEMRKRILYYAAKLITQQVARGDEFEVMNKVVSIIILDENLLLQSPRYHHLFKLYDYEAQVELTDLLEVNTLELQKLHEREDGTQLYDWARFIAAEDEEELSMLAQRNPEIGKAVVKLRELSADERVRDTYFRQEMLRRDIAAQKKWEREKGRTEGREEGRIKERLDLARSALGLGVSIDIVMKMTHLPLEALMELRNESASTQSEYEQ